MPPQAVQAISDDEVRQILCDLPGGFVRAYVESVAPYQDAPLVYHLGAALTLVASVIDPLTSIDAPGLPMRANLYALVIGPSGSSRKSTAIDMAKRVLREVNGTLVAPTPGSYEGLVGALAEAPQCTLFDRELGRFLSQAGHNRHLLPLKTGLLDIYDCGPITKALADTQVVVPDTRLSMLAGCAPSHLESHLTIEDIDGGFLARFLLLPGERSRWVTPQAIPQDLIDQQVGALRHRMQALPPMRVQVAGDNPVADAMCAWARNMDQRAARVPEAATAVAARIVHHAYKIGLVLTCDLEATSHSLGIRGIEPIPVAARHDAFLAATRIAELHARAAIRLAQSLPADPRLRLLVRVRAVLVDQWMRSDTPLVAMGLLSAIAPCLIRDLRPVMDTLVAQGFAVMSHQEMVGKQIVDWYAPGPAGLAWMSRNGPDVGT